MEICTAADRFSGRSRVALKFTQPSANMVELPFGTYLGGIQIGHTG